VHVVSGFSSVSGIGHFLSWFVICCQGGCFKGIYPTAQRKKGKKENGET